MEPKENAADKAFARVVWAAHILQSLSMSHDKLFEDTDADDGSESDCDRGENDARSDDETKSDVNDLITSSTENLREKCLNCIAELLSRQKGWHFVTTATLREREDSVEVDIARNSGFDDEDGKFLDQLQQFMEAHNHVGGQEKGLHDAECWSFLNSAIDYYHDRIDEWARVAMGVWKRTGPHTPSPATDCYSQHCVLDLQSKGRQADVSQLLSLFTDALFSRFERLADRRRKLVLLAYACLHSENLLDILSQNVARTRAAKALSILKLLARPVANLQILTRVARTLPSFQTIKCCRIPLPATTEIRKQYIISLQDAWDQLGLPPTSQDLTEYDSTFKMNCSRKFSSHAEVQMVQRYEESLHLVPSIDYIGCSKKVCLLCESFLQLSLWRPRLRGRHGGCYPRWGLTLRTAESQTSRLEKLCELLERRILRLLESKTPIVGAVAQSSLVTTLDTLDISAMDERANLRQQAERQAQDSRERSAIMNDPRSRGPQRILYPDVKMLCVMCQMPGKRCTACQSCTYCSKRCQSIDWPTHRLLCPQYVKKLSSRPSPCHRLAIWFRRDHERPRLAWAGVQGEGRDNSNLVFDGFLGAQHAAHWSLPFSVNSRRSLNLGYTLCIYYEDYSTDRNNSIFGTAALSSTSVPYEWCGEIVVVSGRPSIGPFADVTLADFRHVQDFFGTYHENAIHDAPRSNGILGVRVNSLAEQRLHGAETFSQVTAGPSYQLWQIGVESAISKALGIAVSLYRINEQQITAMRSDESSADHEAPYYNALLLCVDASSEKWGTPDAELRKDGPVPESFLLLRSDGRDLKLAEAICICRYCEEVLRPLFELSMSADGSLTRAEVLEAVNTEAMVRFGTRSGIVERE